MASTKVRGITIELGADGSGIKTALAGVNSSIRSTSSQLKDINRLMKLDPTSPQLAAQKFNLLQTSISQTKSKLDTLKQAESQLKSEMQNGGTEKQQQQLAALQREIIKCESDLKKFQNTIGSGNANLALMGARFTELGGKISSFGKAMMPVSAAITAFGAAAVAAFKNVDEGSKNVIYATGLVGESAQQMRESFKNVAGSVAGEFSDIGNTVGAVAVRFNLTGTELENLSKKFQQFATVAKIDGQTAVAGVDMALRLFNVDSSEAGNVMGLLMKAFQETGKPAGELLQTLQTAGPTFKEMGLSIGGSVQLMTMFQKEGIDATEMMTKMRKAATEFSAQGKDMNAGLQDLIARLKDSATAANATQEAYDIFGKRAGLAFVQAAQQGKISLTGLSDSLKGYEDVVEDTYNETRTGADKIAGAWKQLKLAMSEFGEVIGDVIGPPLKAAATGLKDMAKEFGKLPGPVKTVVVALGLLVGVIGPVALGIGKLIIGIGNLLKSLSKLSVLSKITALANPVTAAFLGLSVAVIAVWKAFSDLKEYNLTPYFRNLHNEIQTDVEDWKSLKSSMESSQQAAVGTAAANERLLSSLSGIVDSNGRVKAGEEERAKVLIGQLNSALGTQYELTGNIITANGQEIASNEALCSSIQQVIVQKEAQALLDAKQEAYTTALQNQTRYTIEYAGALSRVRELEEGIAQIQSGNFDYEWAESVGGLMGLNAQLEEEKRHLSDIDNVMTEANGVIAEHDSLIAGMAQGYDATREAVNKAKEGVIEFSGVNNDVVKKAADDAIENLNNVVEVSSYASDKVANEQVQILADALARQLAELDKAGELTAEAVGNITEEAAMAMAKADIAGKLTGEAKAGFEAYLDVTCQSLEDIKKLIQEKTGEQIDIMGEAGRESSDAYAQGIESGVGEAGQAGADVASSAGQGMQEHNQGDAFQWGSDLIHGFVEGIKSFIGGVVDACKSVADTVASWLHFSRPDKGPLRKYDQWMPHMMQGLAKTLKQSSGVLIGEVAKVATNVQEIMTGAVDYNNILDGIKKIKAEAKDFAKSPNMGFSMSTPIVTQSISNNQTEQSVITKAVESALANSKFDRANELHIDGMQYNNETAVKQIVDMAINEFIRVRAM